MFAVIHWHCLERSWTRLSHFEKASRIGQGKRYFAALARVYSETAKGEGDR